MSRLPYPQALSTVPPGLVAVAAMMLGFIVLALSFVVGVGQVQVAVQTHSGAALTKETGYGSALNWSLCLTLVLPAALLYLCKGYQAFPLALRNLVANRMIVSQELQPTSEAEILDLWRERLERYQTWLLVLIGIGLLFTLWEWFTYSTRPLWLNDGTKALEQDWSVGVLFGADGKIVQAPALARLGNGALSLLAFLGQATILAALLTFIYKALVAGLLFTEISRPEGRYRLLPDPRSHDARLGFECVSDFIEEALLCIGFFYGIFYLSRIQNIFLRSSEPSMMTFLVDRLLLGILKKPFDLGVVQEVFVQGMPVDVDGLDYSSIMVSLGAFAVLIIAAYMIGATVRDAAVQARGELEQGLRSRPADVKSLFGLEPEAIEKRLDQMVVWPVKYIRAREIFSMIVLGVTCIFFYKIGMILIGLVMFRVFWEVIRYLISAFSAEGKVSPSN